MKIHLGSGSVYLYGYVNLDIPGPRTRWACDRPDLVEKLGTTDDAYYARHSDKTQDLLRSGPLEQEYVCDGYGDFHNLPDGEISELLARQCFEHLSITEARRALERLKQRMKTGTILRLDVPDHEATLRKYRQTGDEFYVRHLLGPRRDDHGFHMMAYTRDRLRALVEEYGFQCVAEEPNIHFYDAFTLRFRKLTDDSLKPAAPHEYVKLPPIDPKWIFADIGPGSFPHPRANVYVDHKASTLEPLKGKDRIISDLNTGLTNIRDGAFDYAFVSHILEHIPNLDVAIRAINRVAKRGTIVVPSAFKDALGCFEEKEHRWHVVPNPQSDGQPIFIRHNIENIASLRDELVQQAMCMLFRTGSKHDCTIEQYLREWFAKKERDLDVVVHFDESSPLKAIVIE